MHINYASFSNLDFHKKRYLLKEEFDIDWKDFEVSLYISLIGYCFLNGQYILSFITKQTHEHAENIYTLCVCSIGDYPPTPGVGHLPWGALDPKLGRHV